MNEIAIIEAILFVAGDEGLTLEELSKLIDKPLDKVTRLIEELATKYKNDETSGILLIETANKYQLVTKKSMRSTLNVMRNRLFHKHSAELY